MDIKPHFLIGLKTMLRKYFYEELFIFLGSLKYFWEQLEKNLGYRKFLGRIGQNRFFLKLTNNSASDSCTKLLKLLRTVWTGLF